MCNKIEKELSFLTVYISSISLFPFLFHKISCKTRGDLHNTTKIEGLNRTTRVWISWRSLQMSQGLTDELVSNLSAVPSTTFPSESVLHAFIIPPVSSDAEISKQNLKQII